MAYYCSNKRKKVWSLRANAKQARVREETAEPAVDLFDPDDDEIVIEIRRKLTGEKAVFECTRGDRIDNYRVYCNGVYQGVQSMTTLAKNIRKALPAFRREVY